MIDMDSKTADILRMLNNDFYARHAESFSETRQHPWPGWNRVVEELLASRETVRSIIDYACGNLRFERFCRGFDELADCRFFAIDSCEPLVGGSEGVDFIKLDIVSCLNACEDFKVMIPNSECDVAVCFGFMHHVPSFESRARLLRWIVESVLPGGIIAVTFWRFMDDEKLSISAERHTIAAREELGIELDANDYLIGWQGRPGVYRYCHHFNDEEIFQLIDSIGHHADLTCRFRADGRNGNMNDYLILKRR